MAVGGGGGGGLGSAIEAGRAVVRASLNDNELKSGLAGARRMVLSWGLKIAAAGGGLMGIGTGILAPIVASFREVLEHFGKFQDLADRTGASAESLSALGYAAEQSDASLEDVANGTKFLQKTLSEAAGGSKEAQAALGKLGLTAEQLSGMSLEDQFAAIADGLANISNPADRTAAALKVLGKGGLALVPMLKDGAAGLRAMFQEGRDVGAIVSGEDAKNAEKIGDDINKAWTAVKNTFRAVGAALLPQVDTIAEFTNGFVSAIKAVREFINNNRQTVTIVAAVAAGVVAAGAALVGIGTGLALAGVAIGGFMSALVALKAVLLAVFSPVGLGIAALAAAGVAIVYLAGGLDNLDGKLSAARSAAVSFGERMVESWNGIRDAMAAGDLGLAARIAWGTVKVEALKVWGELKVAWTQVTQFFEDGWDSLIYVLESGWNAFGDVFEDIGYDMAMEVAKVFFEVVRVIQDNTRELRAWLERRGLSTFQDLDINAIQAGLGHMQKKTEQEDRAARTKRDKALGDDLDRKREERQRELDAQIAAAEGDVEAARNELKGLIAEAKVAANTKLFADFMNDVANTKFNVPGVVAAITAAGSTRGTFGGRNLAQQFMGGPGSTQEKIEDHTRKTADNTKRIADREEGLEAD